MKKSLKFLSLLLVMASVSGCYDTAFEDDEEYYDIFDDTVYLAYFNDEGKSFTKTTESLEDCFYNKETVNDFDEDCLIDAEYYAYLAVCLESDSTESFKDICLYIRGEESTVLEINFYIRDELPRKLKGFNSLEPKQGEDSYDDDLKNPCATVTTTLETGKFTSVYVSEWILNETKIGSFSLQPEQYLFMQFVNNTGYGKSKELKNVKFTMTNLIMGKK